MFLCIQREIYTINYENMQSYSKLSITDASPSKACRWDGSNVNPFATSSCVSQSASSTGVRESENKRGQLGCADAGLLTVLSESV